MNWLKYKFIYLSFSTILVTISVLSILFFGLRPAIDFTGGSLTEISLSDPIDDSIISEVFTQTLNIPTNNVVRSDDSRIIIKSQQITNSQSTEFAEQLASQSGSLVEIQRFESIGPVLGSELLQKTLIALVLATILILAYLAYVFKNIIFGLSAILAMLHDTVIIIGSFAIFGKIWNVEVDSLYVTAVLTTLSFSVYDTVVVYDRIRESIRKFPNHKLEALANKSITETLPRSLNTSMTLVFMLVAMILIGGDSIHWMAIAFLIGAISGTYSSPFVAVPLLVIMNDKLNNRTKTQK